MSDKSILGSQFSRWPIFLGCGALALGLLAMAGLTSAPPDVPGPGEEAGLGGQGGKKIFYMGTVTLERRESGHYSFKRRIESGASTTITRDLNAATSGTWAVSLQAIAYESELVTAGGSGSGKITHSHNYAEHVIDIDANKRKVEKDNRSMDDPVNGPVRVTVMLSAADGTYTVGLAPEEGLEVVRRSQYSRKETIPGGQAPKPENTENAVALPLPIMAFSEPKPWVTGDSLADEYVFDDRESAGTFCPGGLSDSDESRCNYTSTTALKWTLFRKVSDCTAQVNFSQGDVFLNDIPMPSSGEIPISKGDVIRTGKKARVQLRPDPERPAIYRVGGSSQMTIGRDPCDPKPDKDPAAGLLTGAMYSWIMKLAGAEGRFTIGPGTAPGVRGSLDLLLRLLAPPLFAQEAPENPGPEEAVLPDGWSSSGVSFYLWSDPSGAVGVRMFRGRAKVEDPAAQKPVILNSGEFYRGPAVKRAKDVVVNLVGS